MAGLFVGGTFEADPSFFDWKAFEPERPRRIDTGRFLPRVMRSMNGGVPLFA